MTPAPESSIPLFVNLTSFTKDGRMINSSPTDGAAVGEDFLLLKVRATVEVNTSGDTFMGPFQTDVLNSVEAYGAAAATADLPPLRHQVQASTRLEHSGTGASVGI